MVQVAWPPQQRQSSQTTSESSVTRRYEYSSYERKSESIEREAKALNDVTPDQHRYLLEQKMQRLREQELHQQHSEAVRSRDLPPVPPPRSHPEVVRAEPAVVLDEPRVREIPVERHFTDNQNAIQEAVESYIVQEPPTENKRELYNRDNSTNHEPIMFRASAEVVEVSHCSSVCQLAENE